jgi:8-oxo-(d)GTP phosphatase
MNTTSINLVRAAGGIIWRIENSQLEVLLIHRPRYDDWALPKGKLKTGERWEEAALREVAEETGINARLEGFAGVLFYTVRQNPKVVLFWNMQAIGPASGDIISDSPDEIGETAWLTVPEALQRLSYPDEKDLLRREAEHRTSQL